MRLIKKYIFNLLFWKFSNNNQRELIKSWIKDDNPNYDWLKNYLDK